MLGNKHYYNRTIRKVVVAFGTLFNDIDVIRYTKDGVTPKEKFKVPLNYGPKEKYLQVVTSDPTLTKTVSSVIPRISFELNGMSYDSSRKQQSTLQNFSTNDAGKLNTQYLPVPYDFNFSLSIYVRNIEDGTQILEQILPFFTPDFTVTVDFIPNMDQKYNMPVLLNSVNTTIDYEGDLFTTRLIVWDLEFTVKGYLWPAVKEPEGGLIGAYSNVSGQYGKAITNIYLDKRETTTQQVYVDYANGNNVFTTGETIRVPTRDIFGTVVYFSNNSTGTLIVENLNNFIEVGDVVEGDYSGAKYTVDTVDLNPYKAVTISVSSDPLGALPNSAFGFSETITHYSY